MWARSSERRWRLANQNPDELGCLWEKTGQRGLYFTGTINGQAVVVFRNDRKADGSKQPDWRILKSRPKPTSGPATPSDWD